MKKMFTLLSALFIGAMATAQVTVTFQVDVTNYVAGGATLDATGIRVGGNFSAMGGQANGGPMADWSPTTATSATPLSIPLLRSIGFAPAATFFNPAPIIA